MIHPNILESKFKRIVIVGGEFAGITLAKRFSKSDFKVVMIVSNNYHNRKFLDFTHFFEQYHSISCWAFNG